MCYTTVTGGFVCGNSLLWCTNYPISEIRTEIFNPIEKDLRRYDCYSPFTMLYTIYVPTNSPNYFYFIEDSNNWIYADYFDIGEYDTRVRVCLYSGERYRCIGRSIDLGSVRLIVEPNSKRLFPHGEDYYLDSRAGHEGAHVDDISVAVRVPNSIPFFDEYYNQLYVSSEYNISYWVSKI